MSKKRSLETLNEDDNDGRIEKENESKSQKVSKNENSSSAVDNMKNWNLKIVSWNVAGIRAFIKKDGLSILENEKPDIICFQEMKCASKKLPQEFRNLKHDYFVYDFPAKQEGYSGVSLVSKVKPLTVKMGIGDPVQDYEGRSITAEYEHFYLVTAYVPNAGRKLVTLDKRLDWEEKMKKYLTNLDKEKPIVYCGDLNVAHEEIDLANPGSNKRNAGFTQEERDSLTNLLKQGFVDTFRHLHPDLVGQYTFWTYMMNARAKNVGWRLDYFLLSKRLMPNLRDSLILSSVKGSDHCPISLLLDFSSGQTSQGQNDEDCPT